MQERAQVHMRFVCLLIVALVRTPLSSFYYCPSTFPYNHHLQSSSTIIFFLSMFISFDAELSLLVTFSIE